MARERVSQVERKWRKETVEKGEKPRGGCAATSVACNSSYSPKTTTSERQRRHGRLSLQFRRVNCWRRCRPREEVRGGRGVGLVKSGRKQGDRRQEETVEGVAVVAFLCVSPLGHKCHLAPWKWVAGREEGRRSSGQARASLRATSSLPHAPAPAILGQSPISFWRIKCVMNFRFHFNGIQKEVMTAGAPKIWIFPLSSVLSPPSSVLRPPSCLAPCSVLWGPLSLFRTPETFIWPLSAWRAAAKVFSPMVCK